MSRRRSEGRSPAGRARRGWGPRPESSRAPSGPWWRASRSPRASGSRRAPSARPAARARPDRRRRRRSCGSTRSCRSRAAGDQRQAVGERVADAAQLLGGQRRCRRRRPDRSGGRRAARRPAPRCARPARPRARRSRSGRSTARRERGRRRRRARRASARRLASAPSSSSTAASSRSSGMHVLPPRSASDSTCSTAARVRSGLSQLDPELPGDPVGDEEADAEHARQLVRTLGHDAVGAVPVGLADPRREIRETVRRQQQMQAARDPQPLPRARRLGDARRAGSRPR